MAILHLGVVDVPYANRPGRRRKVSGTQTTGDVAGFLENRYHVMEHFFQLYQDQIGQDLADAMQGALENLFAGGPASAPPLTGATSKIEDAFKNMLATKELERLGYPGIPTKAALRGVSHRFKRPYQRRAARPSFIDTGLYQASFKAWVD